MNNIDVLINFKFIYRFTQSRQSPGICFCVYEVRTNTTEHGPLLPVVEDFSSNSVQNELYSANIITTNTYGMEITVYVGTVKFSKSPSYQWICTWMHGHVCFVPMSRYIIMMCNQIILQLYPVD